jgi:pyruvate,water dikinase
MWDVFPDAMMRGFKDATREYGALLDCIEVVLINGFLYSAPRPVGAPKGAKGPPPKPIFKLLVLLHPEVRRRVKRADEVFRTRAWRKELKWWDEEVKPKIAAEAQTLLAEDLAAASNGALAAHVRRATDFARRTVYFHHRLNACAMVPLADFLTHTIEWTGLSPQAILVAFRGLSPLSAATGEIEPLRMAFAADGDAMMTLLSDAPPAEILDELMSQPTPIASALRQYLDTVGYRVLGAYDVGERHARESPELIVKILRAAVTRASDPGTAAAAQQAFNELRDRVPAAQRGEFDALLEEARATYRVRDERNFCSDAIGTGMARRAILAAGERLKRDGRVYTPGHLVDATESEIVSLLEGTGGPSADELEARYDSRMTASLDDAPERLGLPPSAPPPADWLPPGAARMQRAINLTLELMFAVPPAGKSSGGLLKGFGVSPGVFEGPARVILDVSELPQVREGEVLVTTSTGPTFNVVLPLLRAIVTERGGALSHAAIVAREYGIPAIVGCPGATTAVKTGTKVRVDGSRGEMQVIT